MGGPARPTSTELDVTVPRLSYGLITPARDEAVNLKRLGQCLSEQTLLPDSWLVVDDGSTDGTLEIAQSLAKKDPWVRALSSSAVATRQDPESSGRGTGRDIVAFKTGVTALDPPPDIVVKLDADVSLELDFFDRLVGSFEADPTLGIAGGVCYELENGDWRPYHVTRGHVRGATRAYRWQCLLDVSPLEEQIGWDAVDEIRANLSGWTTRSISDLPFYHHRPLGARDGSRRQWQMQGVMAHYLGYRASYLVARALWRGRKEPAALSMVSAYAAAAWRREPRCSDERVRAHVRREQRLRALPLRFREALGRTGS